MQEKEFLGMTLPGENQNVQLAPTNLRRGFTGLNQYTGEWSATEALHLSGEFYLVQL